VKNAYLVPEARLFPILTHDAVLELPAAQFIGLVHQHLYNPDDKPLFPNGNCQLTASISPLEGLAI
jgi:hypothetical protein